MGIFLFSAFFAGFLNPSIFAGLILLFFVAEKGIIKSEIFAEIISGIGFLIYLLISFLIFSNFLISGFSESDFLPSFSDQITFSINNLFILFNRGFGINILNRIWYVCRMMDLCTWLKNCLDILDE